ncbi:MAG TPA: hypothetical protein VGO58_05745 [Chitinophagaceae bacterium]|jgi:hypothetical protein|nr:hypothetical protein [Chitinophagaceae bacterium]
MRHTLFILLVTVLISSCNSDKSKEEAKTTDNKDSIGGTIADTAGHPALKDTEVPLNGLDMIDGLILGLVDSKTIEELGQPDSKSKAEEWDADGLIHQDWKYRSKGITLNMSGEKKDATQQIFSITITTPSGLKTSRNIGIGSDYKDVMAAYQKEIDKEASIENMIVVGSVYGGIIFHFKNEKVEKIFIGAAAE